MKHVVRLGGFHGADDPYFVHRFGATLWAPDRVEPVGGVDRKERLAEGSSPIAGAEVFVFEKGTMGEAMLRLDRDGGVLVTCDAYQNWTTFEGCSLIGRTMMRVMGFGPTLIGGPWVRRQGWDVKADFERLRALSFDALMPAHGTPLLVGAKAGLDKAIADRFG